ncbi:hypothetical protein ACYSNR_01050 [Enterococcus sp. LJL128]
MSKQVNFSPELKKVTSKSNGNIEVLMVVSNDSLRGKSDDLWDYLGKTVQVVIHPETYEYSVPYNKQTNKPNIEYVVNQDGTVEVLEEEQTSLDLEDGVAETEERQMQVDKDIIDSFIMSAHSLEYPDTISINPRDVLDRVKKGDSITEIAVAYEMSEFTLLNQLEIARKEFAPFADAWAKNKVEIQNSAESDDEDPYSE